MLNKKVLQKLGSGCRIKLCDNHIDAIVNAKPGGIERALL
jgi:hypothetical protein